MGWLDLLAVQGTLQSFLQYPSSKAPSLRHSAFSIVQLSHSYMTIVKIITLTMQNFVGKVMSLHIILSRLVITFLPRSKHLLISSLKSPPAVILEPPKINSHCFHCFPIYSPWSEGTRCHEFSECWVSSQLFHSLSLSSKGSLDLFAFCHKCGVICIAELIDISPSNLDSSLCFFHFSVSHDVLCM